MTSRAALVFFFAVLLGCRKTPPPEPHIDDAAAGDPSTSTETDPDPNPALGSSRRPSHSAEPKAEGAWLDGGADPACTGKELAFEEVIIDPRCATTQKVSAALVAAASKDGGAATALKQEAKRDGDHILVALVNAGMAPVTLPLSWHPSLPSFTVLAEGEERGLYELASPKLDVRGKDGAAVPKRAYFARIVLPPGGRATGRLKVDPTIVKRLDRSDGGAPPRLTQGKYTLHVAQLVSDVEAGPPVRVTWEL